MIRYISLLLFIGLAWGQDCTADDGTDGVELWSECYSIENTTELHLVNNLLTGSIPPEIGNLTNLAWLDFGNNRLTGSIPPEIGNLKNLTHLNVRYNQLNGKIPESICDLNIEWSSSWSFNLSNNQLCPPYPFCIEDNVGHQDTNDCP